VGEADHSGRRRVPRHGHSRPDKMVLVGMSMGGYLAPRAAAFDERFDGVVA
jgi:dienelactone hydrolase